MSPTIYINKKSLLENKREIEKYLEREANSHDLSEELIAFLKLMKSLYEGKSVDFPYFSFYVVELAPQYNDDMTKDLPDWLHSWDIEYAVQE